MKYSCLCLSQFSSIVTYTSYLLEAILHRFAKCQYTHGHIERGEGLQMAQQYSRKLNASLLHRDGKSLRGHQDDQPESLSSSQRKFVPSSV